MAAISNVGGWLLKIHGCVKTHDITAQSDTKARPMTKHRLEIQVTFFLSAAARSLTLTGKFGVQVKNANAETAVSGAIARSSDTTKPERRKLSTTTKNKRGLLCSIN